MRFLVFVTNDAEHDKIISLLKAKGIWYEKKVVRSEDEKAQGYMFYVEPKDFDIADELLSTPTHDMSFDVIADHKAYRDEATQRDMSINARRRKELRRIARLVGIIGVLYMLYQWFIRS